MCRRHVEGLGARVCPLHIMYCAVEMVCEEVWVQRYSYSSVEEGMWRFGCSSGYKCVGA